MSLRNADATDKHSLIGVPHAIRKSDGVLVAGIGHILSKFMCQTVQTARHSTSHQGYRLPVC